MFTKESASVYTNQVLLSTSSEALHDLSGTILNTIMISLILKALRFVQITAEHEL